jgi:hypothetical protein
MIEAIRAGLAARANPDKAPAMQAYMKSEMPFLGVQKPERTALLREVITALHYDAWQTTVLTLWREAAYREERYMALAVAGHRRYREHRTMAALPLFDELIVTGAWWDFVDEVAVCAARSGRTSRCSTTASNRIAGSSSSSCARASDGRSAPTRGSTPTRSCATARHTS